MIWPISQFYCTNLVMKSLLMLVCLPVFPLAAWAADTPTAANPDQAEINNKNAWSAVAENLITIGTQDFRFAASDLPKIEDDADRGNAAAAAKLGFGYLKGSDGLAKDYGKAVTYWQLAAAQGIRDAQYALGCLYFYGTGVPKNREEGLKWWHEAAKQGQLAAQRALAAEYFQEQYTPADEQEKQMLESLKPPPPNDPRPLDAGHGHGVRVE